MGGVRSMDLALERDKWQAVVDKVTNFRFPCNVGNFWTC